MLSFQKKTFVLEVIKKSSIAAEFTQTETVVSSGQQTEQLLQLMDYAKPSRDKLILYTVKTTSHKPLRTIYMIAPGTKLLMMKSFSPYTDGGGLCIQYTHGSRTTLVD